MKILCSLWLILFGVLIGWFLCGLLARMLRVAGNSRVGGGADSSVDLNQKLLALQNENQSLKLQLGSVNSIVPLDFAAAKAAGFALKSDTDFTIIEGIGPKINQLILDDGISSFVALSQAPVQRIQDILDRAGPRYRLAKPDTWPEQARLASQNKWQQLKQLQDELDGGVKGESN